VSGPLDILAIWSAFVSLPDENRWSERDGLADFSLVGSLVGCVDDGCLDISE